MRDIGHYSSPDMNELERRSCFYLVMSEDNKDNAAEKVDDLRTYVFYRLKNEMGYEYAIEFLIGK